MSFDAMFKPFAPKAQLVPNRTERRVTISDSRARRLAAPCRAQPLKPYRRPPAYRPFRTIAWTAATVRMRGLSAPPPSGDTLTSGRSPYPGEVYAKYPFFPPVVAPRDITRTPLVPQGDELIDLQLEWAHPGSVQIEEWEIGGEDVGFVDLNDGVLTFKASQRASLPKGDYLNLTVKGSNAYGSSGPHAARIRIPLDADCWFADFVGGSDAANGRTPATAKKYCPDTSSYTGSAVVLGADDVIFFKAVRHRYRLAYGTASLDHAGTAGHPMTYALNGWGGCARISGDDDITGWADATSGDVSANPDYANIDKIDLTAGGNGGAIEWYTHLYFGDVMGYPAQWPKPDNLWDFEDCTVDMTGGMRRATVSASTGNPRISQAGSGGLITIVDTLAAARFGASVNPTGWPCNYWSAGNRITRGTIASFDHASATFTVNANGGDINAGSVGAYAFTHHPFLIEVAGQFATNTARTQAFAHRPNTDTSSVNRRDRGLANNQSYTIVEGGIWERFFAASGAGMAIIMAPGGTMQDPVIRNVQIRQCRPDDGAGVIHTTYQGPGSSIDGLIAEGNRIVDHNPHASGFRFGGTITGAIDGTPEQVAAAVTGKIINNLFGAYSLGQSTLMLARGNGLHIDGNVFRKQRTVHGNQLPIYGDADDAADDHHLITNNFMEDSIRCIAVSIDADRIALPRSNNYRRNICLGDGVGFIAALYDGEPDSFFDECLFMGGGSWGYSAGAFSIGAGNRVTIRNCVIAGMSWATPLSGTTYTVQDCLFTKNLIPPNDGATRVSTGNTLSSPLADNWDGVFTPAMEATLGPGQIGLFWNIAA